MTEKEILNAMEKLDLTREQAIEMLRDDESDELLPEQIELAEKAKSVKRYTAGDKTQRKTAKKERKIDTVKLEILKSIYEYLNQNENFKSLSMKNEVEITFQYMDSDMTLKLIRHRKK